MRKRILYLLAILTALALSAAAVACGKSKGNETVLSGFDVPEEALVSVGSEYEIPVPLVTDEAGNVYEVSYEVTCGGQSVKVAGGIFVAEAAGDYIVTYTLNSGSGLETRATTVHARYRAAVSLERNELYVGETVSAEALGIKALTDGGEIATGFTLTLTAADGSAVSGAVPSAGTYELKVTMLDDTCFADSAFVMEAVDPYTVTFDFDGINVIVGESVDLSSLSPTIFDRLSGTAAAGYDFSYASDTAEIEGTLFTATDAGGQTVTVTATGADRTVTAEVTIPTRATVDQTNSLYDELLAVEDKTTEEFYARGARLQRYYDSLSASERADVNASEEEVYYLAGGVVYGGDKLVYFDTSFGEKQVLRMADGYQTTEDGEFIYDYNNYAFVTGDNYISGERGVLKLMRPSSMYSVGIYFDGSKIPGDFDQYDTLGFKLRHNGRTVNGKIICVINYGDIMVKRTVDIAAEREVLFTFNLKEAGATDWNDIQIIIYDGTYNVGGLYPDFECYISSIYSIHTAPEFSVTAAQTEFNLGDTVTAANFSTDTGIACGYDLALFGEYKVLDGTYRFRNPGVYTVTANACLPYTGSAKCTITVRSTIDYVTELENELKAFGDLFSDEFLNLYDKYRSAVSVLPEGVAYNADAAAEEIFGFRPATDGGILFDMGNEYAVLSQLVFRQNRSGNFTRYTNYEVVHESGLISGYDSVLKMGYPDLGDRLTLGFALSDLFVGDIGDYPSISFVIKHNGRILAGEALNNIVVMVHKIPVGIYGGKPSDSGIFTTLATVTPGEETVITINLEGYDSWDEIYIEFREGGWNSGFISDFEMYVSPITGYTVTEMLSELQSAADAAAQIADKTSDEFIAAVAVFRAIYNKLPESERSEYDYASAIKNIYGEPDYAAEESTPFNLGTPLGLEAITVVGHNGNADSNYSLVADETIFDGQSSALLITRPTGGNDFSFGIVFSDIFSSYAPSHYDQLVIELKYEGKINNIATENRLDIQLRDLSNSSRVIGLGSIAAGTENSVKVKIPGSFLAETASWNDLKLLFFADAWNTSFNSDSFRLYVSSVRKYTVDDAKAEAAAVEDKTSDAFATALANFKTLYGELTAEEQEVYDYEAALLEMYGYTPAGDILVDLTNPIMKEQTKWVTWSGDILGPLTNYSFAAGAEGEYLTGYTNVLKVGQPPYDTHASWGFALRDVLLGDISEYQSISFTIKHNGKTPSESIYYHVYKIQEDFLTYFETPVSYEAVMTNKLVAANSETTITIDLSSFTSWNEIFIRFSDGAWNNGIGADFEMYVSPITGVKK